MKLTDERRNEIERNYLKFCQERPFEQIYQIYTKDLQDLLSSEKAWKEEAERQRERKYARMVERAMYLEQLNQAVEVLEWIRDSGTDYQSIKKAASFLSSLSQETEQ